ncbi:MAG TPA: hypothetical protein VIK91_07660 [Nannocystis sp.]
MSLLTACSGGGGGDSGATGAASTSTGDTGGSTTTDSTTTDSTTTDSPTTGSPTTGTPTTDTTDTTDTASTGSGSTAPAGVCGDAVVDDDEACDDGNDVDTDACSNACLVNLPRIVFVTSAAWSGDLGGLTGADAKCQMLAEAAGLTGTYKAWLSTESEPAKDRLTHYSVPYVRTDGVQVAADWDDLTDGTLAEPIDRTEQGDPAPIVTTPCVIIQGSFTHVFTQSWADGSYFDLRGACTDWSSGSPDGGGTNVGVAQATDAKWTDACHSASFCALQAHLYCVQQ